jgi:hypothetical protein
MRIGIDFDNTIVCYDGIFHRTAVERGLIAAEIPVTKGAVRDHLRATGREPLWTELQGFVYGPGLAGADPFPGVWDFMREAQRQGIEVKVVSHKTRHPYEGPAYDLHVSALSWLREQAAVNGVVLREGVDIYLEPTKQAKLERIGALACDWFIDDLPEFLSEPNFPIDVKRVLFDPAGQTLAPDNMRRVDAWADLTAAFFGPTPWPSVGK